ADVKVAGGFVYAAGTMFSDSVADGFVRKYDPSGAMVWERQFGTPDGEDVTTLQVVGSQVFVGGVTLGAFPGFVDTTPFMPDPFVITYDANGNLVSTLQVPRLSSSFSGNPSVGYVDATGFYGTDVIDGPAFDPDIVVFKFDLSGNLLWSRVLGTSSWEQVGSAYPRNMSVGPGGIYVTGSTQGAFDGQVLSGYEDAFVARLDFAGNLMWIHQVGATELFSWGSGVAAADDGGVYGSRMQVSLAGAAALFLSPYNPPAPTPLPPP